MARSHKGTGNSEVKRALVEALYTEIRAARITGAPWKSIRAAVRKYVDVRMSAQALQALFAAVDREYEAKTGVKALPAAGGRMRKLKEGKQDG